jgi:hypothetical protein
MWEIEEHNILVGNPEGECQLIDLDVGENVLKYILIETGGGGQTDFDSE